MNFFVASSEYGTLPASVEDPGFLSRIRIFPIPEPGTASQNLSLLTQKWVSKLSEIWSGLFIPDPDLDFLPIPDPGVKKAPHPGSAALLPAYKEIV
jgi:hypothetical protein